MTASNEECQVAEDMLGKSVREFVAATAAKTPTPGGGSVGVFPASLGWNR